MKDTVMALVHCRKKLVPWINFLAAIIAFLTAIIALVAAFLAISQSNITEDKVVIVKDRVVDLRADIDQTPDCWAESDLTMTEPKDGDQVSSKVIVWGQATPGSLCRYVGVYVRSFSTSQLPWRLTDSWIIDRSGKWSGVARLDHIVVGESAEIHARLTARSVRESLFNDLENPPVSGVPSETIRVWRIE